MHLDILLKESTFENADLLGWDKQKKIPSAIALNRLLKEVHIFLPNSQSSTRITRYGRVLYALETGCIITEEPLYDKDGTERVMRDLSRKFVAGEVTKTEADFLEYLKSKNLTVPNILDYFKTRGIVFKHSAIMDNLQRDITIALTKEVEAERKRERNEKLHQENKRLLELAETKITEENKNILRELSEYLTKLEGGAISFKQVNHPVTNEVPSDEEEGFNNAVLVAHMIVSDYKQANNLVDSMLDRDKKVLQGEYSCYALAGLRPLVYLFVKKLADFNPLEDSLVTIKAKVKALVEGREYKGKGEGQEFNKDTSKVSANDNSSSWVEIKGQYRELDGFPCFFSKNSKGYKVYCNYSGLVITSGETIKEAETKVRELLNNHSKLFGALRSVLVRQGVLPNNQTESTTNTVGIKNTYKTQEVTLHVKPIPDEQLYTLNIPRVGVLLFADGYDKPIGLFENVESMLEIIKQLKEKYPTDYIKQIKESFGY